MGEITKDKADYTFVNVGCVDLAPPFSFGFLDVCKYLLANETKSLLRIGNLLVVI